MSQTDEEHLDELDYLEPLNYVKSPDDLVEYFEEFIFKKNDPHLLYDINTDTFSGEKEPYLSRKLLYWDGIYLGGPEERVEFQEVDPEKDVIAIVLYTQNSRYEELLKKLHDVIFENRSIRDEVISMTYHSAPNNLKVLSTDFIGGGVFYKQMLPKIDNIYFGNRTGDQYDFDVNILQSVEREKTNKLIKKFTNTEDPNDYLDMMESFYDILETKPPNFYYYIVTDTFMGKSDIRKFKLIISSGNGKYESLQSAVHYRNGDRELFERNPNFKILLFTDEEEYFRLFNIIFNRIRNNPIFFEGHSIAIDFSRNSFFDNYCVLSIITEPNHMIAKYLMNASVEQLIFEEKQGLLNPPQSTPNSRFSRSRTDTSSMTPTYSGDPYSRTSIPLTFSQSTKRSSKGKSSVKSRRKTPQPPKASRSPSPIKIPSIIPYGLLDQVTLKKNPVKEHFDKLGYQLEELLGQGSFGKVYRISKDGTDYAVKIFKYKVTKENINTNGSLVEAFYTKYFNHPNVISRYDYGMIGDDKSYFIMELASSSLSDVIKKLDVDTMVRYMMEIARGTDYIHVMGQVHCDVKPANTLIVNGTAKLADMSLMSIKETLDDKSDYSICQTHNYQAPEQYMKRVEPVSSYMKNYYQNIKKFDMIKGEYWSLGVVFLEMVYGRNYLIRSEFNSKFIQDIGNIKPVGDYEPLIYDVVKRYFGSSKNDELLKLICLHLIQPDPNKRDLLTFMSKVSQLYPSVFGQDGFPDIKSDIYSVDVMFKKPKVEADLNRHKIVIRWINEVMIEFATPLIVKLNVFDFYIQYCHRYEYRQYQLIGIISIYIIFNLLNGPYEIPDVDFLLYMCDNAYTPEQFNEEFKKIMADTNGFPIWDSLYRYLWDNKLDKEAYKSIVDDPIEYIKYNNPQEYAQVIVSRVPSEKLSHKRSVYYYDHESKKK